MPGLTEPIALGEHRAPSRVVFGPHETNLARRREISDRHVAYYARRAAGGAGVLVVEAASVAVDDWPYERAPLAADAGPGWAAVAEACAPHGTVVLAGLGHAGGQGSSAYSQSVLWAPSPVADSASREMPAELSVGQIDALAGAFADGARRARAAGLAGVELDAGAFSLLRQFHSGLTNQRGDAYGEDRLRFTREVVAAVRDAVGPGGLVALRLCGDELAPWAGVTPEQAAEHVDALAASLDLLTVVRGGPYSTTAYRPDGHTAPGFNAALCRDLRAAAAGRVPVVLQGSVVDPGAAQSALDDGTADLVEMTRALVADASLVARVRAGAAERVRPCILCNQACRVRDGRNPIVSCVADPGAGHETDEPDVPSAGDPGPSPATREVLVAGGGPAGLECARVLARRGHRVAVAERSAELGGTLRAVAALPGRNRVALLADWLVREAERAGVALETGREVTAEDVESARAAGTEVVLATGSRSAERRYHPAGPPADVADAEGHPGPDAVGVPVIEALDLLRDGVDGLREGALVVHDPVGGPVGVGVSELLAGAGREVTLVTPDQVAGTLLSLSGDLADANVRLQQAGVTRALRSLLRSADRGRAVLEDVWTGERREIDCAVLVDCGHRLPEESLHEPGAPRAGDAIAPRSILEAVLEGRRLALAVGAGAADEAAAEAAA